MRRNLAIRLRISTTPGWKSLTSFLGGGGGGFSPAASTRPLSGQRPSQSVDVYGLCYGSFALYLADCDGRVLFSFVRVCRVHASYQQAGQAEKFIGHAKTQTHLKLQNSMPQLIPIAAPTPLRCLFKTRRQG